MRVSAELREHARRYAAALGVMREASGSPVGDGGDAVLEAKLRACLSALDTLPAEIARLRGLADGAGEEVERDAYLWKADALKFQVERAARIAAERIEHLASLRTAEDEEAERQRSKADTLHWFKFYAWGYDPRNTLLPVQPYVPYPHQEPYIRWLDETVMVRQVSGVVEKSRDEGATVGTCSPRPGGALLTPVTSQLWLA